MGIRATQSYSIITSNIALRANKKWSSASDTATKTSINQSISTIPLVIPTMASFRTYVGPVYCNSQQPVTYKLPNRTVASYQTQHQGLTRNDHQTQHHNSQGPGIPIHIVMFCVKTLGPHCNVLTGTPQMEKASTISHAQWAARRNWRIWECTKCGMLHHLHAAIAPAHFLF